jgi:hypothetical protein
VRPSVRVLVVVVVVVVVVVSVVVVVVVVFLLVVFAPSVNIKFRSTPGSPKMWQGNIKTTIVND